MNYQVSSETLKGKRILGSEDNYLADERRNLFIVCDAKGAKGKATRASQMVIDGILKTVSINKSLLTEIAHEPELKKIDKLISQLEKTIHNASMQIRKSIASDPKKAFVGTSLAMMVIAGETAIIAQVGEARIYVYREGKLEALSNEKNEKRIEVDSLQLDVDDKTMTEISLHNGKLLGANTDIKLEVLNIEINPEDRFLLCTDGIYKGMSKASLTKYMGQTEEDPCKLLLDKVLSKANYDNATSIVLDFIPTAEQTKTITAHKKFETLKAIPLFSLLDFNEVAKVLSKMSQKKFTKGDQMVVQDEKGQEFYVMLSGEADVIVNNKVINSLIEGDYFGELALIDKNPRSATVKAKTDIDALVMHKDHFYKLISRERKISIKLLWKFTKTLSRRLREADLLLTEVEAGRKILPDADEIQGLEFEIEY